MKADTEHEAPLQRRERRQPSPVQFTGMLSGVGRFGIGAFILNMLTHQGATLEAHMDLIRDNKDGQEQVLMLLKDMQQEFTIDIQRFELSHIGLKDQMNEHKAQQKELIHRLEALERTREEKVDWRGIVRSLRLWVEDNFQRRSAASE